MVTPDGIIDRRNHREALFKVESSKNLGDIIPTTQISVLLDCSRINWLIYYPPSLHTYRNGRKISVSIHRIVLNFIYQWNFLYITPINASWFYCSIVSTLVIIDSLQTEQLVFGIFTIVVSNIIFLVIVVCILLLTRKTYSIAGLCGRLHVGNVPKV